MISLCGRACQTVERAINGYQSRLAVTSWPRYAVEAMEVRLLLDAAPVDPDRTFGHPLEDNGTKNLTLATGEYTLEVDADPNGNHLVDWYTTPSGTGGPQDTAGFYYYDNQDFSCARRQLLGTRRSLQQRSVWQSAGL